MFKIDIIPRETYFEAEILSWEPLPMEPLGVLSSPFHEFHHFTSSRDLEDEDLISKQKSEKVDKKEAKNYDKTRGKCIELSLKPSNLENWRNGENGETMKKDSRLEKAKQRVLEILRKVKKEHFGALLNDLINEGYCGTPLEAEAVIKELVEEGVVELKGFTLIYRGG
mgnify:CR=1 FL=1